MKCKIIYLFVSIIAGCTSNVSNPTDIWTPEKTQDAQNCLNAQMQFKVYLAQDNTISKIVCDEEGGIVLEQEIE